MGQTCYGQVPVADPLELEARRLAGVGVGVGVDVDNSCSGFEALCANPGTHSAAMDLLARGLRLDLQPMKGVRCFAKTTSSKTAVTQTPLIQSLLDHGADPNKFHLTWTQAGLAKKDFDPRSHPSVLEAVLSARPDWVRAALPFMQVDVPGPDGTVFSLEDLLPAHMDDVIETVRKTRGVPGRPGQLAVSDLVGVDIDAAAVHFKVNVSRVPHRTGVSKVDITTQIRVATTSTSWSRCRLRLPRGVLYNTDVEEGLDFSWQVLGSSVDSETRVCADARALTHGTVTVVVERVAEDFMFVRVACFHVLKELTVTLMSSHLVTRTFSSPAVVAEDGTLNPVSGISIVTAGWSLCLADPSEMDLTTRMNGRVNEFPIVHIVYEDPGEPRYGYVFGGDMFRGYAIGNTGILVTKPHPIAKTLIVVVEVSNAIAGIVERHGEWSEALATFFSLLPLGIRVRVVMSRRECAAVETQILPPFEVPPFSTAENMDDLLTLLRTHPWILAPSGSAEANLCALDSVLPLVSSDMSTRCMVIGSSCIADRRSDLKRSCGFLPIIFVPVGEKALAGKETGTRLNLFDGFQSNGLVSRTICSMQTLPMHALWSFLSPMCGITTKCDKQTRCLWPDVAGTCIGDALEGLVLNATLCRSSSVPESPMKTIIRTPFAYAHTGSMNEPIVHFFDAEGAKYLELAWDGRGQVYCDGYGMTTVNLNEMNGEGLKKMLSPDLLLKMATSVSGLAQKRLLVILGMAIPSISYVVARDASGYLTDNDLRMMLGLEAEFVVARSCRSRAVGVGETEEPASVPVPVSVDESGSLDRTLEVASTVFRTVDRDDFASLSHLVTLPLADHPDHLDLLDQVEWACALMHVVNLHCTGPVAVAFQSLVRNMLGTRIKAAHETVEGINTKMCRISQSIVGPDRVVLPCIWF